MSNCSLEHCWDELPAPCLQVIASNLNPQDSLSARLACSTWANSIPLPQISLNLTVTPSGISCEGLAKIQALLLAQQLRKGALGAVGHVVLSLTPASNACACAPVCALQQAQPAAASNGSQQQQGGQQGAPSTAAQQRTPSCSDDSNPLLAQALASSPSLTSAVISVNKPKQRHDMILHRMMVNPNSSCSAASSREATMQDCHTVLLQLLALPQLQQQLLSLTLACEGVWPNHQQLAAALQGITNLTALQLLKCPVSALTRLPSLPQLQQLAVSGRLLEPIPRSYSARSLPLLPRLPGLRQLSIRRLSQDVQRQEELDIYSCMLQQQKAAAAAAACCADHAPCDSSSSSSNNSNSLGARSQQQQQLQQVTNAPKDLSRVTDWRSVQQWVSSSIQQQCPSLVQLHSDMPLGQGVTQMHHLRVLAAPPPPQSTAKAVVGKRDCDGNCSSSISVNSSSRCAGVKGCIAVCEAGLASSAWCCCQQRVLCCCCS